MECTNPSCPNKRRVADLEAELRAVYGRLEEVRKDGVRCKRFPKGERCALLDGHEGSCKWANGD